MRMRELFVAGWLAVCAAVAASAPPERPILRFAALSPVTLLGEGFARGERLQVVLSVGGSEHVRTVIASDQGTFSARFENIVIADRCNSDVWARASAGEDLRAWGKLPQPQCPPVLAPPSQ